MTINGGNQGHDDVASIAKTGGAGVGKGVALSKPLVAPKKPHIGGALPRMGRGAGGTATPPATTAALDDYAALLRALRADPDRAPAREGTARPAAGGSGATEEERAARRARIRARRETRRRDGGGAGPGAGFAEEGPSVGAAGASVKELPQADADRGVPVKSWLAIAAVAVLGLYKLRGLLREPEANKRSGGGKKSKKKVEGTKKVKKGAKVKGGGAQARGQLEAPPALEWLDGSEAKSEAKPARKPKKKAGKKRRGSKLGAKAATMPAAAAAETAEPAAAAADVAPVGMTVGPSAVAAASEDLEAPPGDDTSASSASAAPSGGTAPELEPFGDDAALGDAPDAVPGGEAGAWQTAQRRSKRPDKRTPPQEPPRSVAPQPVHKRVPRPEPPRKAAAVKEGARPRAHKAAAAPPAPPPSAKARSVAPHKDAGPASALDSYGDYGTFEVLAGKGGDGSSAWQTARRPATSTEKTPPQQEPPRQAEPRQESTKAREEPVKEVSALPLSAAKARTFTPAKELVPQGAVDGSGGSAWQTSRRKAKRTKKRAPKQEPPAAVKPEEESAKARKDTVEEGVSQPSSSDKSVMVVGATSPLSSSEQSKKVEPDKESQGAREEKVKEASSQPSSSNAVDAGVGAGDKSDVAKAQREEPALGPTEERSAAKGADPSEAGAAASTPKSQEKTPAPVPAATKKARRAAPQVAATFAASATHAPPTKAGSHAPRAPPAAASAGGPPSGPRVGRSKALSVDAKEFVLAPRAAVPAPAVPAPEAGDAALARRLQREEERLAARAPREEAWAEVPGRRHGKRTAAVA